MKPIILLLTFLIIASCRKEPEGRASHEFGSIASIPLGNTTNKTEAEISALAERNIRERVPMPSAQTEQCWKNEISRPKVKDICLLLWSIGKESSKMLEGEIVNGISSSPFLAKLILLRPDLLSRVRFQELVDALRSLTDMENFYKVSLAKQWLSRNIDSANREKIDLLLTSIRLQEAEAPSTLRDLAFLFLQFDKGRWSALTQNYCTGQAGETKIRCWRYLSLFSEQFESDTGLRNLLLPFWPKQNEPEWKLFVRSFPNQARKIQIHTNE